MRCLFNWGSGCPIPDYVSENQVKFESMIKKTRELEENGYLRARGSFFVFKHWVKTRASTFGSTLPGIPQGKTDFQKVTTF